ncbi:MAG: TetR/AcrR family transcriptional regulator [Trebonia sp.]
MTVPRQEAAETSVPAPAPAPASVAREGRVLQKARTRDALVAATRRLLRDGVTPSVEQAADAARVSRTTAYRYFSSQRELLATTFPHLEGGTLLGDSPPADVRARVALFAQKMTESILANEAEMRAMLRLSLEPRVERVPRVERLPRVERREVALRGGRRQVWVADALAPLRSSLPAPRFERLVLAIAATAGIESFVWLVDVGGADRATAAAVIRSNCAALLEQELRGPE